MKKRLSITLIPLVALALLLAMLLNRLDNPRSMGAIDSPLIGKTVPALDTKIAPPYIVNFFASWCAPCAIENPLLLQLKKQGINIIGVAYKDTAENIKKYLQSNGNPYADVLYDDKGQQGIIFGITGVPESFAINSARIVRARQQGPFTEVEDAAAFVKGMP